jgi:hypothetical protein
VRCQKKWELEPDGAEARIQSDWRGTWLVLRCANKNTLPLVAALTDLRVRAWTPMWVRRRRFPRSTQSRSVLTPCLPSFVFLAEPDAPRSLLAGQGNGVPGFSFMNSYGVLVRIKDDALESLRKVADLNPRRENPVVWPAVGESRRIISGSFQGLIGKVVGKSKRHCLVELEGGNFQAIKIPPFLLEELQA